VRVLEEAVSLMRPNQSGNPSSCDSHRTATSSSSLPAVDDRHSMWLVLRAAEIRSPAMPGSEPVRPK
jgi:hypothetical protein